MCARKVELGFDLFEHPAIWRVINSKRAPEPREGTCMMGSIGRQSNGPVRLLCACCWVRFIRDVPAELADCERRKPEENVH